MFVTTGNFFAKDQKSSIFSRGILRSILSHYTGIAPNTLHLKSTCHGKPLIDPVQNPNQLSFNVSHTDRQLLYAFTKGNDIGIDIEYVKNAIDYQGIAKRFFSAYEHDMLMQAPSDKQHALFYKIWTCKEAYIKAIGLGLNYPLADFDVCVLADQTVKIDRIKEAPHEATQWTLHSFKPSEGCIAAIATKQRIDKIIRFL